MSEKLTFAPGARLLIRDEEWLVKATLPTATDGVAVRVVGISELVRNHEALFLSELDEIQELKPEATTLVADDSPQYRRSRLYLESLLRRTPPTDERIYLGHEAAINYAPYQMEPAHMALAALRPRVLIADGVGLGKTIEVGVLLSELIKRGRGERILVIAIRSMLAQFQQEIWSRFAIPLVRLDSIGLQRVRSKIPTSKNPFYYYDRVIISIDTLKNDAQYRHYLEQCHWDVIVIDECHNVANTGSQRNRLAGLLARTCDSLILTSATPHNGKAESFANLMNMLEPTAIADVNNYTAEEIAGLFTRRFKKDIEDQVGEHFSERQVELVRMPASAAEEAFFAQLAATRFHTLRGDSCDELYRIGLLKGFLSSPAACLETIKARRQRLDARLRKLRGEAVDLEAEEDAATAAAPETEEDAQLALLPEDDADQQRRALAALTEDLAALQMLAELAAQVDARGLSKLARLYTLLRQLGADGAPSAPRVIIFSERIATLQMLRKALLREFRMAEAALALFHAGLPDVEQQRIVEDFGKADTPIRVLLASDVASEGVNLHYFCHLMIHFDIPWSLITLEQRNGRIDRYGQEQPPLIYYLLTVSQQATVKGDLRILDKLIEKEAEAHKNIGDAATLLGLHSAQEEEAYITAAVAAGVAPEVILPEEPQEPDWWLTLLAEAAPAPAPDTLQGQRFRLYPDDLAFARAAFEELLNAGQLAHAPEFHPNRPEFTLFAPDDLRRRCLFLPQEALPADWTFRLTTDRQRMMAAARKLANTWPEEQLFWELHPVMQWLLDRLLIRFGRHEAPVIVTPVLAPHEFMVLFQGILSNQRSQPVITQWFSVVSDEQGWDIWDLDSTLQLTGFVEGSANSGQKSSMQDKIQARLPDAVKEARKYMDSLRKARADQERDRVKDDWRRMSQWRRTSEARIQQQLANTTGAQRAKLLNELEEVRKQGTQRGEWLKSFSTEQTAYIRVAAVFSGA